LTILSIVVFFMEGGLMYYKGKQTSRPVG
jgi:hypothetical protein